MKKLFITLCFIAISITSVLSQQIVGQNQKEIKKQLKSEGFSLTEYDAELNADFFINESETFIYACWYDSNKENYCYQFAISGNSGTLKSYNTLVESIKGICNDRGDGFYMNYATGLSYLFKYDRESDLWQFFSIDMDYVPEQ